MKVEKIIEPTMKKGFSEGRNKLKTATENTMKEFNDRAAELAGRSKVLIDSAREISDKELAQVKEALKEKMLARGFSQSNIDYLLGYTEKYNWELTKAFVDDMYAHTSTMCWAVGYSTPQNANLMKDAVLKKNYDAFYRIKSGSITDVSQIQDMRKEVIENGRIYNPVKNYRPVINQEEFQKERRAVLDEFKKRGVDLERLRYASSVNEETIEVAKVILEDSKNSRDERFVTWFLPYTNAENAELMLRAMLNKDYAGARAIPFGRIREFATLDARYAYTKRIQETEIPSDLWYLIEDETSDATKILFEDSFYDYDMIKKIIKKINKNNVKDFKEALLHRDLDTLSKLCGEKLNYDELAKAGEKVKKPEYKTVSNTGKISRADFVYYMDEKLLYEKDFSTSDLKDSERRNLAKLFGTTEEQILNMDKKEYRRLCIKFHPDKNPDDKLSTPIFRILNSIFLAR